MFIISTVIFSKDIFGGQPGNFPCIDSQIQANLKALFKQHIQGGGVVSLLLRVVVYTSRSY